MDALGYSDYESEAHALARDLLGIINAPGKPYTLRTANRLYGRDGEVRVRASNRHWAHPICVVRLAESAEMVNSAISPAQG